MTATELIAVCASAGPRSRRAADHILVPIGGIGMTSWRACRRIWTFGVRSNREVHDQEHLEHVDRPVD